MKNYEDIQVYSGSHVYLNGEDHSEHIEEVEIFETTRRVVRVYSANPITHDEARELVEELYEASDIVMDGSDDVHDLRIE